MDKKEILNITKNLQDIVAVAPNAFSRVVPSAYFPNYSIVCFKYRGETDQIAKDIDVFCIEKNYPEITLEKMNAKELLTLPQVEKYINKKKDPHILIYKPTKGVEAIAYETGWKIIGNSPMVKYDIENKLAFRNLLQAAGIDAVTGETVLFDEMNEDQYSQMVEKYGEKLVFQVAEITVGGGTGTAFINNINDFSEFMDKFSHKREKLPSIEHVNITKFMEGIPTSIAACATKFGVITGRIQTQILDIPEVRNTKDGSGLFCGHDFSFGNFSDELNNKAKNIAKKFGEYIYKNLDYKGIFGLDLITNTESGECNVIECNPRYTDAFPLISELYAKEDAVPMDVFHILEHMNTPYEIDVDEISESYKNIPPASQIILETKTEDWTKVNGNVKAGVYNINQTQNDSGNGITISYLRPGYRFEHLQNADEFLVTEGVPMPGAVFQGGSRILRLIFAKSILANTKELTTDANEVVDQVYKLVGLEKSEPKVLIDKFLDLRVAEIEDVKYYNRASELDADMVNLVGEYSDFGYIRPNKISWGAEIKSDDPFSQLKAKRLKKHLKYWLSNLTNFGLTYEVIDNLSSKEYALWFTTYLKLLSSKEKANIKISKQWLSYKQKTGKKVGAVFLYKGKIFLGGNLFIYTDTGFTVAYGIVEKIKNPNWSLGAVVDFLSLKKGMEFGYKKIGFGQDNNLYGYHLSPGLLQYKLNFGLIPHAKDTTPIYSTKFINYKKFADTIAFLGIKDGENVFYVLKKKGTKEELELNTDLDVIQVRIES